MTKTEITEAALSLPPDEQLELARVLFDHVAPDPLELTPELRDLLRERLAQAQADPHGGVPWEEVHRKIERSLEERHTSRQ